jgi:hypothetical protein
MSMKRKSRLSAVRKSKKSRLPYVYLLALGEYNTDFEDFKKLYMKHGGDAHTAQHLWTKWKSERDGDFLSMVGNLDLENIRIMGKVADDIVRESRKRNEPSISKGMGVIG